MKTTYTITFDIQSYWHIGDGRQAGVYADDTVRKLDGLPFIPGASVRGLLKDAFRLAELNHWFGHCAGDEALVKTPLLFGEGGENGTFCQGLLQLTNATLSDIEQQYFRRHPQARNHLYTVLNSTAINDNGVAAKGSLRSMEVSVPMQLYAELSINTEHPKFEDDQNWFEQEFEPLLPSVLALLTELGAKRSRGFGRVRVSGNARQEVAA